MRLLNIVTQILLIIGGINWLLIGAFGFDLVAAMFAGPDASLTRLVYIVVGFCAIWQLRLGSLLDDRSVKVSRRRT